MGGEGERDPGLVGSGQFVRLLLDTDRAHHVVDEDDHLLAARGAKGAPLPLLDAALDGALQDGR